MKIKKMCMEGRLIFLLSLFLVVSGFTTVPYEPQEDWIAPAQADAIKNPLINDTNATKEGGILYKNMCAVCHGAKGKGDGIAGINLKPRPANLSIPKTQSQTDGAIYWKITEGKPPMATYKNILTDNQRWQLVNYMRQLSK